MYVLGVKGRETILPSRITEDLKLQALWFSAKIKFISAIGQYTQRRKGPEGERRPAPCLNIMIIKPFFSIWLQISSFSFFCAGNFSDLLIIRICLSSAYVFLFLNSALGAPLWPLLDLPDKIQIDGVAWAVLNLYVHLTTIYRLLRDEFPVKLSPDKEALWRMFYRTGGLSKTIFQKTVGDYCTVVTLKEGDDLSTDQYFYIVYTGTVKITVTDDNGATVSSRQAQSGQLFDFRALGLLQDHHSLAKHRLKAVVAVSNVTLFSFPRDKIASIASHPSTRLMWKEILMENLLRIVQRYFDKRVKRGTPDGHEYLNPIFLPLERWEQPDPLRAGSESAMKTPFAHIFASAQWSFAPPWPFKGPPMGLRHTQLLAPGRVQNMPPKNLLASSESQSFVRYGSSDASTTDTSYQSINEDESFLEYLHEIDEEIGGMDIVGFKTAVSFKAP
jgi:CRP-like cAMP-binding protein